MDVLRWFLFVALSLFFSFGWCANEASLLGKNLCLDGALEVVLLRDSGNVLPELLLCLLSDVVVLEVVSEAGREEVDEVGEAHAALVRDGEDGLGARRGEIAVRAERARCHGDAVLDEGADEVAGEHVFAVELHSRGPADLNGDSVLCEVLHDRWARVHRKCAGNSRGAAFVDGGDDVLAVGVAGGKHDVDLVLLELLEALGEEGEGCLAQRLVPVDAKPADQ